MKKGIPFLLLFLIACISAYSQEKKFVNGFDGGMMVHTGYVMGDIEPLGYHAKGCPFGIGGVVRLHVGEHWRIGSEGYVSTLKQLGNGSYLKFGWGGVLVDFYWPLGRFVPYVGLTVGGGATTAFLMMEAPREEWEPVGRSYYHSQAFMAIDPFVGCDFVVSDAFHLTLKMDWLNGMGRSLNMACGPRLYLGFIFYH